MKNQAQSAIDLMGEYLYERMVDHAQQEDVRAVKCIHDEWVVDGKDPEDDDYEFLFLEELVG